MNDLSKMVYHSTNNPYNFNIIKAQERVLDELAKEGLIEWEEIK